MSLKRVQPTRITGLKLIPPGLVRDTPKGFPIAHPNNQLAISKIPLISKRVI